MILPSLDDLRAEQAKRGLSNYIGYMWQKSNEKFKTGLHTTAICNELDEAIVKYRQGISSYLLIKVPFRHGKSDIVSRYFPTKFVGEFPEDDVIVAAHSTSLVLSFSRFARKVMRSEKYGKVYPDVHLASDNQSMEAWEVESKKYKGTGHTFWMSLRSGIAGKGGNCIIVDDFFRLREEAESPIIRDKVWTGLTDDVMTRTAPVCIFIVLATPWHVDDPFGRIKKKMEDDPNFPRFKELKFPALSDKYPSGTLFPERFDLAWYAKQKATLGKYGTASLLQCDPEIKEGNLLPTDNIEILEESPFPDGTVSARGWDLASSSKQIIKDDPDYTVGVKTEMRWTRHAETNELVPYVYVSDVRRGQWEAPRRDKIIKTTAINDGVITVGIEAFAGYKDTYNIIKNVLSGIRHVKKINMAGDKVAKAQMLIPILEAGHLKIKRADWNDVFLKELSDFPGGTHDDIVDALTVSVNCHNPYATRIWDSFDPVRHIKRFKIGYDKLSEYSVLFCGIHTDKQLKTSVLLALWNKEQARLYIITEKEINSPQPDDVLMFLSTIIKSTTNIIKKINFYGNDILFKKSSNIGQAYRERGILLKESKGFDELGSIAQVDKLFRNNQLFINEDCVNTKRQALEWSTSGDNSALLTNNVVDDFGYCHSLNLIMSAIYRKRMLDKGNRIKPIKRYSKGSNKIQKEIEEAKATNRLSEFIVNGSRKTGNANTNPNGWAM